MPNIDLKSVLQRTVSSTFGDLVTRRTGKAVRDGIEQELSQVDAEQVAVIDFSTVRCLDYSCADEIVGKLLLAHGEVRYFLLQGITAAHRDAIEPVLERHHVAVAARDRDGTIRLLGPLDETARQAFAIISSRGGVGPDELATELALPPERVLSVLETLQNRRLLQREQGRYTAPMAE
ncbi:MAG: hypothetical protein PVF27_06595 [Gemmatimonadales bacterium]|jgi:hypothetical protein